MNASYDFRLVILSFGIAAISSYTALDLAGRVSVAKGWVRFFWLIGGAIAMGFGIWSMHFVAMLAYMLPVPMAYDSWIVLISMVVAMLASGIALSVASLQHMGNLALAVGGIVMGLAIAAMHYIGMAAMKIPAIPQYNLRLVILSVAIAIGASVLGLWLAFHLRQQSGWVARWQKMGSAIVMGNAIAGMHYTGMASVSFYPAKNFPINLSGEMDKTFLAIAIAVATLSLLILIITASSIDKRIHSEAARTEALRQSEERFRSLVQHSSDIITIISPDATIQYKSPSIQTILGHKPEDAIGKNRFDFIHPEDVQAVREALNKSIAQPESIVKVENRFQHSDGSWIYLESVFNNSLDDPNIKGIVINSREITERKQVEAAILRQQEWEKQLNIELERQVRERTAQLQQAWSFDTMLKRIADKVRDSLDESQILPRAVQELAFMLRLCSCDIVIYDPVNSRACTRYEYTSKSKNCRSYISQVSHYSEEYEQLLTGESFQFCLLHPLQGWVTMLACPIFDDSGIIGELWLANPSDYCFNELEIRLVEQVANQCAIAIRQARLYHAVQAQVAELEKLNHIKDDFLSTVSHELRTPITNIKMAIQMLKLTLEREGATNGLNKTARYLQILENECERESMLINDLLDLQRLDSGTPSLTLTAIKLETWIPEILEPFKERIQQHEQELTIEIAPNLPVLVSDSSSLERVVAELLQNACKYTPAGEAIKVKAACMSGKIQIKVINSGTEIPEAEQARIFEKFYRISRNDPWKQGGTGLGLALVKKLIEHLGGEISVSSTSQETCFKVELPLKRVGANQVIKPSTVIA